MSHVLIHCIGADAPEDYIIVNAEVSHLREDVDEDEESFNDVAFPNDSPVPPMAVAAAANSPFACQICLKIFPNEEKMVKHKQNAHRQDALVSTTLLLLPLHVDFHGCHEI